MKFTKHTFLMLGLASVLSLGQIDTAVAAYDNCTSAPAIGSYCRKKGTKPLCPKGCYCPDTSKKAALNAYNAPDGACENHWSDVRQALADVGLKYCPDDFPYSDYGASSPTHCYNSNHKYYTKNGTTTSAVNCPNEQSAGKFCKNIDFLIPTSQDCRENCYCMGGTKQTVGFLDVKKLCKNRNITAEQLNILNAAGVYLCPDNFPYSEEKAGSQSKCYTNYGTEKLYFKPVFCKQGEYLPKGKQECEKCLTGSCCPGNYKEHADIIDRLNSAWYPSLDYDQGLDSCDSDTNNFDSVFGEYIVETPIDSMTITVSPGQYLPANRVKPVDCTGAKKFCPGGKFMKKEIEQGRYDCPFNSTPTKINPTSAGFDGCDLNLTQEQMKNGISGNGECWKKTDPDDYRYCIYGMRFELPNNYIGGGKGPAVYSETSIKSFNSTGNW